MMGSFHLSLKGTFTKKNHQLKILILEALAALEAVYLYHKCVFIEMKAVDREDLNLQYYKLHNKENVFCFLEAVILNL